MKRFHQLYRESLASQFSGLGEDEYSIKLNEEDKLILNVEILPLHARFTNINNLVYMVPKTGTKIQKILDIDFTEWHKHLKNIRPGYTVNKYFKSETPINEKEFNLIYFEDTLGDKIYNILVENQKHNFKDSPKSIEEMISTNPQQPYSLDNAIVIPGDPVIYNRIFFIGTRDGISYDPAVLIKATVAGILKSPVRMDIQSSLIPQGKRLDYFKNLVKSSPEVNKPLLLPFARIKGDSGFEKVLLIQNEIF